MNSLHQLRDGLLVGADVPAVRSSVAPHGSIRVGVGAFIRFYPGEISPQELVVGIDSQYYLFLAEPVST